VADRYEFFVAGLASCAVGGVGGAPQIVVAGGPDDAGEARGELLEGVAQVVWLFADVAGDDEPVVWECRQHVERGAIARVTQMQV
jgi:hypothetical protein